MKLRYLIPITLAWIYYLLKVIYFNWQPFNLPGLSSILLLIIALFSLCGAIALLITNRKKKIFTTLSTGFLSSVLSFHLLYLHFIQNVSLGSDVVSYFPYF